MEANKQQSTETGAVRTKASVWETVLRVVIAIASALAGLIGGQAMN